MPDPVTHTLDVPGAVLTYDVRGDLADQPVLLMIGSPMGASGFPTLASHFADRTVVTYDPRGVERSTRADGAGELSPNDHAGDLAALIEALDAGPVELFASSGGAVNALALMAQRPDLVKTLVAHEPPLAGIIPDHEAALAACEDIYQTYQRDGMGAGMAKFIAIVGYEGEIPADYTDQPAPDPAMFGLLGRGRRLPQRRPDRTEPARLYVVPARLRRARQGESQARPRIRRGVRQPARRLAAGRRSPSASG